VVGEPTKRSLVIVLGIIGMSALFLMVIPSARSSDTKGNQIGYYLVDILEERKELPEVQGILSSESNGRGYPGHYELKVTLLKGISSISRTSGGDEPYRTNVLLGSASESSRGIKKRDQSLEHEQCDAGTHHMPLRVSAKYVADREGEVIFLLRLIREVTVLLPRENNSSSKGIRTSVGSGFPPEVIFCK